ncbi:AbiH family protein [Belliella aquatica]|nr:AbiH family protein [Belliella aquatica]MCH7405263.1 bacteriophage abortive infection AbiH family protein [Belliella aquatica]
MDFSNLIQPKMIQNIKVNPDIFDEYSEVNRLIIIGNGFDLAHGLKTSFKDFIKDYLVQILNNIKNNLSHKDELISLQSIVIYSDLNRSFSSLDDIKILELFEDILKRDQIIIHKNSELLERILKSIKDKSWVDIELDFFHILKEASMKSNEKRIIKINEDLNSLKIILKNYLLEQVKNTSVKTSSNLLKQFIQKISKEETSPNTLKKNLYPKSICFLNFNYTSLPLEYIKQIKNIPTNQIPIHGELKGDDMSTQGLVFGYGDELDDDYLKFENMNNDSLFENIKSFKYLHFNHYRDLLEFINSKPFQVHIYGHSCGLSDRTLLNTVFENENCISIKLFYHKWNAGDDFEKKTYAISRHFKSKSDLRAKVVNRTKCEAMIQPKTEP